MTTRANDKNSELVEIFSKSLRWHKVRIKFFVSFICALFKLQTVCFTKLAQGFEGSAKVESNLRRIQRFFAGFIVDGDMIARLVYSLLPSKPPYRLCLDRTNWKFGSTDINILMISIAWKGLGIPILWSILPKAGNSNFSERRQLLQRYVDLFGADSIESLMADREFIGSDWFDNLIEKQTPFYIRIREKMWVDIPRKGRVRAFWLFNRLSLGTALFYDKIVCIGGQWVYLSGMKVLNKENKIEFVIVATFRPDPDALIRYKDRWQIETMFKAFKSSGFNLEDTHLSDVNRISKMLSLLSVAFVWAYITGIYRNDHIKPIPIKKHGRRAYSFFKYGLIFIAHTLLNSVDIHNFQICTKVLSCT